MPEEHVFIILLFGALLLFIYVFIVQWLGKETEQKDHLVHQPQKVL